MSEPARESRFEAIRLALRELGYIEGRKYLQRVPISGGDARSIPELAAELVRLKVDIIVATGGGPVIQAPKNATKTIPIVMVGQGADPVEAGLVDSLPVLAATLTALQTFSYPTRR